VTANDRDLVPGQQRRIALVAHDGRKKDMREWAEFNRALLACHELYATGTTGRILSEELGLPVTRFQSARSAGTSRSVPASRTAGSTCLSSSGTRWNRTRTTTTSRPCCGSRCCGTSRSPATGDGGFPYILAIDELLCRGARAGDVAEKPFKARGRKTNYRVPRSALTCGAAHQ